MASIAQALANAARNATVNGISHSLEPSNPTPTSTTSFTQSIPTISHSSPSVRSILENETQLLSETLSLFSKKPELDPILVSIALRRLGIIADLLQFHSTQTETKS